MSYVERLSGMNREGGMMHASCKEDAPNPLNWWQEVAHRRAVVCADPNSEDARAQGIWRRFRDCIIHFFAQLSASYKAFYDTEQQSRITPQGSSIIEASKFSKDDWLPLLYRDAQFRMNPADKSMPENGKAIIDALGAQAQPTMEDRGNEGIMKFNPVTERVVQILRTHQQRNISDAMQDEAYDQLMDYCRKKIGQGGSRAMNVLRKHENSNWGYYEVNIKGKEYFARAWIFAQLCENPEEAKTALVIGLSNAVNDYEDVVCIWGTLNHITVTLFMGRLYGIAQEDHFYRRAEQYADDFFVDDRIYTGTQTYGDYRRGVLDALIDADTVLNSLEPDIRTYWQNHIPNKPQRSLWFEENPDGIYLDQFREAVRVKINEYFAADVL